MRRARPVFFSVAVSIALGLGAANAHAGDPSAADIETARAAFLQGLDLRDKQHDFTAAIARLKAAYALVPTPRIGFELGRTMRANGDYVGARNAFIAAMQLPVRPNESAEAKKARVDAEGQANDLDQRTPQLAIHLAGTGQVYVDGEPIRHEALVVPRRLNPGSHVIQLQVDGDVRAEQTITLREGERRDATLTSVNVSASTNVNIAPNPNDGNAPAPYPTGVGTIIPGRSNAPTKAALAYTATILAGVGIIPGLFALGFMKSAQNDCADNVCNASYGDSKTLAYGFAVATDVLWGAALVVAIVAIAIPSYTGAVNLGVAPAGGHGGGGSFSLTGRF